MATSHNDRDSGEEQQHEEHPTPECPNCGSEKTRPIDREWASCFDCDRNWMMTEEQQQMVAEKHWDA